MHLNKFATAFRLRWPWLQWKDPSKIWARSGHPCTKEDMDIFYAVTTITIGNGCKTPFSDAPWLGGRKPIDIAPLIFAIIKRKTWKVNQAMKENAWIRKITLDENFIVEHLRQFAILWGCLQEVHLLEDVEDNITWNLTANGQN
jgi:hypothetical protein